MKKQYWFNDISEKVLFTHDVISLQFTIYDYVCVKMAIEIRIIPGLTHEHLPHRSLRAFKSDSNVIIRHVGSATPRRYNLLHDGPGHQFQSTRTYSHLIIFWLACHRCALRHLKPACSPRLPPCSLTFSSIDKCYFLQASVGRGRILPGISEMRRGNNLW